VSSLQEITFVFGQPVAGNPTQYLMEKAFVAAGLDWRYLTLEVTPEQLPAAVAGVRAMGFRGGNITMPHKLAVLPHLDELSRAASLIGAVNCIVNNDGRLLGENTDGKGFVQALRASLDPAGKKVVILGAGGAARAIAVELAMAGTAEITVVNRSAERGEQLAQLLVSELSATASFQLWEGDYSVPQGTDLLVNATSIGLFNSSARVPLVLDTLAASLTVADVVFNPANTRLLHEASKRGCPTVDGLGMLVNQAAICFQLWTGISPDVSLMREALEEFLSV